MRRNELILNLWAEGKLAEDIAELATVDYRTVYRVLSMARARGDQRAARRIGRLPAMRRRRKIKELIESGKPKEIIAKTLGVTKRRINQIMAEGLAS